jgi:hypothetical protein
MTKPVTPQDIAAAKGARLPEEVIDVFNDLIVQGFSGSSSQVVQGEAAELIAERLGTTVEEVYKRGLLNVEEFYRAAGWNVRYDKPGFNESYAAFFVFSLKDRP